MSKSMFELVQAGVGMALEIPLVALLADTVAEKAPEILKQHFTLSTHEIGTVFQKSFGYGMAAIAMGMAPTAKAQHLWLRLRQLAASKVSREFSMQMESCYLQPFCQTRGLTGATQEEFRDTAIQTCLRLAKAKEAILPETQFPEVDVAALMNESLSPGISTLLLDRIQVVIPMAENTAALLAFEGLLGDAVLFFVREQLRCDQRVERTLAALGRAGLSTDIRQLKDVQQQMKMAQERILDVLQTRLDDHQHALQSGQQALIEATQNGDFARVSVLAPQLSGLQQSAATCQEKIATLPTVVQGFGKRLARFENRFGNLSEMLSIRLEATLEGIEGLGIELAKTRQAAEGAHQETLRTGHKMDRVADQVQAQSKAIAMLLRNMEYLHLEPRVQARDEFTQHTERSRHSIQTALQALQQVDPSSPGFSRAAITVGSALSSLGEQHLERAERLFEQGQKMAKKPANQALAAFNLFQIRLRQKNNKKAFEALQMAITIDPKRFAPHDSKQYTLQAILGSGSLGCTFLAHPTLPSQEAKPVVIKTLWDTREGTLEEVFQEVFLMGQVAGEYVPKPLAYGFGDPAEKKRPYVVMEYLEGVLNGEQYLQKHGPLPLATGLEVGVKVAHALVAAHQAGICHFDIKPANLALQSGKDFLRVTLIDFGMARVARSLRQKALAEQSRASDKSPLGQEIISTLAYAAPEQLGGNRYGKPGPHSDFFGFGATLYHLLTGESPRTVNPMCLPPAPIALYKLLCQCMMPDPTQRPASAEELVTRIHQLQSELSPPKPARAQSTPKRKRRRPGILNWVFAIGLLLVIGLGYWWMPISGPTIDNHRLLRFGEVFQDQLLDGTFGPRLVVIPPGDFLMGDLAKVGERDEQPVHSLQFQRVFALGVHELSVGQFQHFIEASGYQTQAEQSQGCWIHSKRQLGTQKQNTSWRQPGFPQSFSQPVVCVNWQDIQTYLDWLSQQTGQHYRLPTEAEWEYAARGGTIHRYWWGADIGVGQAVCNGCGSAWDAKQTAPTTSFSANPFGLYDTVANVWEWTCSLYKERYTGEEQHCAKGPGLRAIRGGSWLDEPNGVRAAFRSSNDPGAASNLVGFRVVRD